MVTIPIFFRPRNQKDHHAHKRIFTQNTTVCHAQKALNNISDIGSDRIKK